MDWKNLLLVIVVAWAMCAVSWAAEPLDTGVVVWPGAVDTKYEIRGGYDFGDVSAYIAPNYDVSSEEFGIRGYGILDVIDANMAANLLGATHALPDGELYTGLLVGWAFDRHVVEGGWLVGGAVEIRPGWAWTLEYQQLFTDFKEDPDRYSLMTGLRIKLP